MSTDPACSWGFGDPRCCVLASPLETGWDVPVIALHTEDSSSLVTVRWGLNDKPQPGLEAIASHTDGTAQGKRRRIGVLLSFLSVWEQLTYARDSLGQCGGDGPRSPTFPCRGA